MNSVMGAYAIEETLEQYQTPEKKGKMCFSVFYQLGDLNELHFDFVVIP